MHAWKHNQPQQYFAQQHFAEFNCAQQSSINERYGNRIYSAIETASQLRHYLKSF
jgi:hypothetical protein